MYTTELHRIVVYYEPKVRTYFRRRIANEADVDDLVQETMCSIIEAYPRFRGDSRVSTWVYAICAHRIHNWYRSRELKNRLLSRLMGGYTERRNDDERLAELAVDVAYERLPAAMKKLFIDRYRAGLSVAQIAERHECAEGTIKYRLYLLRIELKRILG